MAVEFWKNPVAVTANRCFKSHLCQWSQRSRSACPFAAWPWQPPPSRRPSSVKLTTNSSRYWRVSGESLKSRRRLQFTSSIPRPWQV